MASLRSRPAAAAAATNVRCSIVVPTFRECQNLEALTRRVFAALDKSGRAASSELIIIDDNSNDGSEEVVHRLSAEFPVRIIVRRDERGLSSAVLYGFEQARGQLLLCMDADLQHPPEKVPQLLDAIDPDVGCAEFVIGTRYGGVKFAVDKDWPVYRQVVSKGGRLLARPLSALSDPMTGFFAVPASVLARADNVNSIGFKICLELAVKCNVQKIAEVPIHFGARLHGESKLTGKVIVHYLQHLYDLYQFKFPGLLYFIILLAFAFLFMLFRTLHIV